MSLIILCTGCSSLQLAASNGWPQVVHKLIQVRSIFIPLENKVGRGVFRNHTVCPSVCSPSCPGHNSVPSRPIWIIFHTIVFHNLRVCHDLDPRSYLQGQGHSTHMPKICVLGPQLLIAMSFHTGVVYDLRLCHDLEPRSYGKGQGHNAYIPEVYTDHNSVLSNWIFIIFDTMLSMT